MTATVIPSTDSPAAQRLGILDRLDRLPLAPLQLAMRIGVGSVFFKAGLLKAASFETTVLLFANEYQVPFLAPEPGARIATFQELVFPVLLFVGLGTRLAALPLLGMIAVIQTFVYPAAWTEHLVWSALLVFLVLRGPGAISVDAWLARRWAARRS